MTELLFCLKKPLITEKSLSLVNKGQYSFEVNLRSKKEQIAKAVEEAFGVHVVKAKTVHLKGKVKRVGPKRRKVVGPSRKKVIVQLKQGEKINLFESGEKDQKAG